MKKIYTILLSLTFTLLAAAQKDVTTFLGIPVDGTKAEMKQKIIEKGFTPKVLDGKEFFEGEFNGEDVQIFIVTNNNKVYRIMICDKNTRSEADIKIRFNNLVKQFENNKRYMSFSDNSLSDEEDISYGMSVNSKRYDAIFYQVPDKDKLDTLVVKQEVIKQFLSKYTEEQLQNPTDEISSEIKKFIIDYTFDLMHKKSVWFSISKFRSKYYITMYYDNEYNEANGEDL